MSLLLSTESGSFGWSAQVALDPGEAAADAAVDHGVADGGHHAPRCSGAW